MVSRAWSIALPAALLAAASGAADAAPKLRALAGAYYFEGWAGRAAQADTEEWARNAPTHLTKRMLDEFPEREPVWGWRDDRLDVIERQIDLAADHGLGYFAFCWYWNPDPEVVRRDSKHVGMELFLKAKNRKRMQFCLLIANHAGFEIHGPEQWRKAAEMWLPYLKHPQHLKVGGKPLVIVFSPNGADAACLEQVQQVARAAGLPGVAIAACAGNQPAGYTHRTRYNIVPGYANGSQQHPYRELVEAHRRDWHGSPQEPCIPIITAGWDKRPWEGPKGLGQQEGWYFPDRTPEQFEGFVRDAVEWMDAHPEQTTAERLLLIYAWNEFGEGGYIAPTHGDRDAAYLKALKRAITPR